MNSNGTAVSQAPPAATVASTALARVNTVEPQTMAELKDFARMAAASRFFGFDTPEQAIIIAMAGKDLGFSYTQSLRAFHCIKGKPALSADGMVAVCLSRPDLCEYFRIVEATPTRAVWETKRVGQGPSRYEFTHDDAKRAKIWNEMYDKHPKRMLSARAKGYLARDTYPELLMGLVTDDEAHEIASDRPAPAPIAFEARVVEPASVEAPTASIVDEMIDACAAAATEADLGFVSSRISEAKSGGTINEAQTRLLRARYREAKTRVGATIAQPNADADHDPPGDDPASYNGGD